MAAVGEDPSQFGGHSYRIGGATALFAAGADQMVIRTMGWWSSDCYRLYVRACFSQTLTAKGPTPSSKASRETVPDGTCVSILIEKAALCQQTYTLQAHAKLRGERAVSPAHTLSRMHSVH